MMTKLKTHFQIWVGVPLKRDKNSSLEDLEKPSNQHKWKELKENNRLNVEGINDERITDTIICDSWQFFIYLGYLRDRI